MIRTHLKAGMLAVDVGAAMGEMTRVMLECVGSDGRVIAVEADPRKEPDLRKLDRPNLQIHMTGAGEGYGMMPLYCSGKTVASRWHEHDQKPEEAVEPLEVPYAPLDGLISGDPDLVKLDVQGSEAHVLEGAQRLLRACPCWILELWPWGLHTANRTAYQVIQTLRANGLTPRWANGIEVDDEALEELELSNDMRNIQANKFWNIQATP
jgi:FkbM family methyltransferase